MPDLKVTSLRSFGSADLFRTETTTYLKSDRKRVEERPRLPHQLWPGGPTVPLRPPRMATITRCDLGRIFDLNLDDREYISRPIPKPLSEEERKSRAEERARNSLLPQPAMPAKPNLLIEISTVDTGDRKQMFGYAARHVITTEKRTPLEGSSQIPLGDRYRWLVHRPRYFHLLRSAPAAGHGILWIARGREGWKNRFSYHHIHRQARDGIRSHHNSTHHVDST